MAFEDLRTRGMVIDNVYKIKNELADEPLLAFEDMTNAKIAGEEPALKQYSSHSTCVNTKYGHQQMPPAVQQRMKYNAL